MVELDNLDNICATAWSWKGVTRPYVLKASSDEVLLNTCVEKNCGPCCSEAMIGKIPLILACRYIFKDWIFFRGYGSMKNQDLRPVYVDGSGLRSNLPPTFVMFWGLCSGKSTGFVHDSLLFLLQQLRLFYTCYDQVFQSELSVGILIKQGW